MYGYGGFKSCCLFDVVDCGSASAFVEIEVLFVEGLSSLQAYFPGRFRSLGRFSFSD